MLQSDKIVKLLNGTEEGEIIKYIEETYSDLNRVQDAWYEESNFHCPEGCGSCCHNFEPDLLEAEALYMAAWLIANQKETALLLAGQDSEAQRFFALGENCSDEKQLTEKTCIFFNKDSPYHCSIYGGRPFVCRLFGGSCSRDKNGKLCWKPCKFYPAEKLKEYNKKLMHRQYNEKEAKDILKTLPPAMSDVMESVLNITPGRTETESLRKILPETIRKLYWLISLNKTNS